MAEDTSRGDGAQSLTGADMAEAAKLDQKNSRRVIHAIESILENHGRSRDEPITLSNGIKLRYRPVPRPALTKAVQAIPLPDPPEVDIGGEKQQNTLDPDWQAALRDAQRQRIVAYNEVLLKIGIEVLEVPEGLSGPMDDGWLEELRFAGYDELPGDMSPLERRYHWLRLYALADPADEMAVFASYTPRTGITVQEVMDAVATFHRDETWPSDREPADEERGEDGDRAEEPAARPNRRVRRARRGKA